MTHKRKERRLQRLERLIKDTNLLEHWAQTFGHLKVSHKYNTFITTDTEDLCLN